MDPATIMAMASLAAPLIGGKKSKGTPGGGGGIAVAPQYSFTEPRLRMISDFVTSNLQSINEGKAPTYYERAKPLIKRGLDRGTQETFFGRSGDRYGSVQAGLEAGSALGIGPKAGAAFTNKALARYESANQAIDEFIAKTGVEVTQDAMKSLTYAGIYMPKGPDVVSFGGYPAQAAPSSDWMSSLGVGLGMMNLFDKNKTSAAATTSSAPWVDSGGWDAPASIYGSMSGGYRFSGADGWAQPSFSASTSAAAPSRSPSWVTDNYSLDFLGALFKN